MTEHLLDNCKKWGVECDKMTKFEADITAKKEKNRLSEIKKLKGKLSALESRSQR